MDAISRHPTTKSGRPHSDRMKFPHVIAIERADHDLHTRFTDHHDPLPPVRQAAEGKDRKAQAREENRLFRLRADDCQCGSTLRHRAIHQRTTRATEAQDHPQALTIPIQGPHSRRQGRSARALRRLSNGSGKAPSRHPSGFFLAGRRIACDNDFSMQRADCLAIGPADITIFPGNHGRYPCLGSTEALADIDLRKPFGEDFRDKFLPVHEPIIRIMFNAVNSNMFAAEITMLLWTL